ncbi:MAG: glycoside hydrolase family 32 protein [Cytophagales bacterium]|nr:MAG: glycoside hydrolase family 32 protein [Cytophagales bacterium]
MLISEMTKKLIAVVMLGMGLVIDSAQAQTPADTAYSQPYRNQVHFSPRKNWTNDPNGLVFHDGEYHLFFQHNPEGIRWGHMTWGHAVSTDLMRWKELAPAITEDSVMAFSGSVVVDERNTSGFGKVGQVPMVAIYTGHRKGNQSQFLAYSLDKGRTWTKYAGNPVVDRNQPDFRDPNVFWHAPTSQWIMSVVLPQEQRALFYGSPNLKSWTELGDFSVRNPKLGIWECPALMPVPVESDTTGQTRKWVMLMSVGNGAVAGGSGMQYFVGEFDGRRFVPQDTVTRFVDYGKDYYAAIQFNHLDRPITIGWMNNWQYANDLPTSPFRGAMTLPRQLSVRTMPTGYVLVQTLPREMEAIRGNETQLLNLKKFDLNKDANAFVRESDAYELTIRAGWGNFGVRLKTGPNKETVIGFDSTRREIYVDRMRSGRLTDNAKFAARTVAPYRVGNTVVPAGKKPLLPSITLHVVVDRAAVEVFVDGLEPVTLTNQIFPGKAHPTLDFFGPSIRSVEVCQLDSVWK